MFLYICSYTKPLAHLVRVIDSKLNLIYDKQTKKKKKKKKHFFFDIY